MVAVALVVSSVIDLALEGGEMRWKERWNGVVSISFMV